MIERLKNLSKRQMILVTVISYITYFLCTILAPVITICVKFNLFDAAKESRLQISGWALVLLLIAAVVGLFIIKRSVNKMSDIRPANAYFKYTLQTISNLVLPVVILLLVELFKNDIALASSTLTLMCIYYIAGGVLDGAVISFIDRENKIRDGALFDKEKDARRSKV